MTTDTAISPSVWKDLACEWLWVYDGLATRTGVWSREIPVPSGVFFVKTGQIRLRCAGQEIVVRPGQAFFTAPGLRQQCFEERTRLLSVGLRCQWPDGGPLYNTGLNSACSTHAIQPLYQATLTLFRQVHPSAKAGQVSYLEAVQPQGRSLTSWCAHETAFRQWFSVYVETLAGRGVQPMPRLGAGDRRKELLRGWLQAWPLECSVDLQVAAQTFQLSPRRLHDLLRAELGMSAQAWHERRRLDHARRRLTEGETPLKEIAFGLGFRHAPHFTAWFRRHTGMTPTAYREARGLEGA